MRNIAVIGTGFIGEYMGRGIRKICGSDDLRGHVFGVKGSDRGAAERSRQLGYDVSVNNTLQVLNEHKPEIVILSVPPARAESVVRNDIAPHFAGCRAEGRKLPDIYSFIPSPAPDAIRGILGEDVNVVKILPNILDRVAGFDLSVMGMNYITFPEGGRWPEDREEVLRECLGEYGQTVAVDDEDSLVLLAGKITSHVCYEVSYAMAEAFGEAGADVSVNDIGLAMRRAQYDVLPEMPVTGRYGFCTELETYRPFFDSFMKNWFEGLNSFTRVHIRAVSSQEADRVDLCSFGLNVFPIRHSGLRQLKQDTANAATKGGILERGIECFYERVEGPLKKRVSRMAKGMMPDDAFYMWVRDSARYISEEAYRRSKKLT